MPKSPQEDQTTLKTSRSPSYDHKNNPQNPMEKGLKKKNLDLKEGKKRKKGECLSRPKRGLGTSKKKKKKLFGGNEECLFYSRETTNCLSE